MLASESRLGKRLKHKETNAIFEVQEIDDKKMWVETEFGDVSEYLDCDLFYDLDYFNE